MKWSHLRWNNYMLNENHPWEHNNYVYHQQFLHINEKHIIKTWQDENGDYLYSSNELVTLRLNSGDVIRRYYRCGIELITYCHKVIGHATFKVIHVVTKRRQSHQFLLHSLLFPYGLFLFLPQLMCLLSLLLLLLSRCVLLHLQEYSKNT